ncbi:MAG TPA: precorrin-6y C5,15-methyltransferase (decarboxylating) subunit CbiE [Dehalococcoidia bacterium]|nr:precorrin-6y C5,15-methyltransferase (decarboxylating) subunit CbiE [Dehalococcoidia bacterium]
MPGDKVYIVGVAPEGVSSLGPEARRLVDRADLVFGGSRLLDMFPSLAGEKITISKNLDKVTDTIKSNLGRKRIVVLASGDPNFYGIASYLTAKLGRDTVEVVPNVSAMQIAFARIKESWEDAALVSVHGRPIEDIVGTVRSNHKIGIFTGDEHTPGEIARVLLENGVDGYRAYVCQNLGEKDEAVIKTDLPGLRERNFAPLNTVILLKDQPKGLTRPSRPRYLGIPDEEFQQRRPKEGLITKQEVRAVSLAKMRLGEESILWDIGAGSGAVSIEASFLARKGRIYAIEKNDTDVAIIKKNIRKFRAANVTVVPTFAPDNLDKLPDPTAVFIGGSGGRMEEILDLVCRRLKPGGRIVINIVALENLTAAVKALRARGFNPDVTLVNAARSTNVMELTRLEALNPVFVVTGVPASSLAR